MLIASMPVAELSVACLTLNPMTLFIHVLIAVLSIVETCGAGAAFEHLG